MSVPLRPRDGEHERKPFRSVQALVLQTETRSVPFDVSNTKRKSVSSVSSVLPGRFQGLTVYKKMHF